MKQPGWRFGNLLLAALLCHLSVGRTATAQAPAAPTVEDEFSEFDRHLLDPRVADPRCVPFSGQPFSTTPSPQTTPTPGQPSTPQQPSTPSETAAPPTAPPQDQLMASRGTLGSEGRIPMMIGDFFGRAHTGATITVPVFVSSAIAATTNGNQFNGLLAVNTSSQVATGPFYAGSGGGPGGFPSLASVGVDTNSDGVLDTFPNLNAYPYVGNAAPGNVVPVPIDATSYNGVLTDQFLVVQSDPSASYRLFDINRQQEVTLVIPTASAGGAGAVVGRTKIAENSSPIPRDRIFMGYSYFDNVPLTATGIGVNRFTPGFEKTFFNGNSSVEVRLPFASTLSSNIFVDGTTNTSSVELGNMIVGVKTLLYTSQQWAVAGGTWVAAPTADDLNLYTANGTQLVQVRNQSVHLLPYVGGLYAPTSRAFVQGFLQVDVDANGSPVSVTNFNNRLNQVGRVNDTTFLFGSLGAGYFVYQDTAGDGGLASVAPMLELHYNRSLQKADVVTSNGFQIGSYANNIQVLDAVVGLNVLFKSGLSITSGYVTPIGNGADQPFNGELRVLVNWFFGGARRFPPML